MTRLFDVQTGKEVRQLLPWWAAIAVTMVALGQLGSHREDMNNPDLSGSFLLVIHGVGAIALGALAIGHEYSYRTLPALLAQPVNRTRLLARKMAVLIVALVALMTVAVWQLTTLPRGVASFEAILTFLLVPAILAVCVTPWWTIASRGPLAGAIFTIAFPIVVWMALQYLVNMNPSLDMFLWRKRRHAMEPFLWRKGIHAMDLFWWSTVALSAVGALMTWRSFVRLQAFDGPHAEVGIPAWLRRSERVSQFEVATPESHTRIGLLLGKELRLHQFTLLASGTFVAIWMAIVVLRAADPEFMGGMLVPVYVMYAYLVALLAGATASAEERQMATAEWHLLLPMSAARQWTIKAATALSLTALLAIGLPLLLAAIRPQPDLPVDFERVFAMMLMLACVSALYVSSISTSGMRALLATLPAIAGAAFLSVLINETFRLTLQPFLIEVLRPYAITLRAYAPFVADLSIWHGFGAMAAMSMVLLTFAAANHKTVDRTRLRVLRQLAWLVVAFILVLSSGHLVAALARVALVRD